MRSKIQAIADSVKRKDSNVRQRTECEIAQDLCRNIANILDGTEWNSDTASDTADLLREAGFTIGEPNAS